MRGSVVPSCPSARFALHLLFGLLALLAVSVGAQAAVDAEANALRVARAMEAAPGTVLEAEWMVRSPNGTPSAVADTVIADFPVAGDTYAVLSTGDARDAENPDRTHKANADNGGGTVRGTSDHDALVLRLRVHACTAGEVSFDYRFLSEEHPRWTGGNFNDAFVAELGATTWTTDKADTIAPDAFRVETVGGGGLAAAHAAGTPYGGATPLRTATVSVPAGDHDLYLSVYDVGRPTFDSAVFLDNLRVPHCEPPCEEDCEPACDDGDLACSAHPCPGGVLTAASADVGPLPAPESARVGHGAATGCAPCPAAPGASLAGETTATTGGPAAGTEGTLGVDGCRPVPCSTGTPPTVGYEAGTQGVRAEAWPEGTVHLAAYAGSAPGDEFGADADVTNDAQDCLAET